MFDEVGPSHSHPYRILREALHHIELMIAREDEHPCVLHDVGHALLRLGLAIVNEGIVGEDVREGLLLQRMLPQVGGLEAVGG